MKKGVCYFAILVLKPNAIMLLFTYTYLHMLSSSTQTSRLNEVLSCLGSVSISLYIISIAGVIMVVFVVGFFLMV